MSSSSMASNLSPIVNHDPTSQPSATFLPSPYATLSQQQQQSSTLAPSPTLRPYAQLSGHVTSSFATDSQQQPQQSSSLAPSPTLRPSAQLPSPSPLIQFSPHQPPTGPHSSALPSSSSSTVIASPRGGHTTWLASPDPGSAHPHHRLPSQTPPLPSHPSTLLSQDRSSPSPTPKSFSDRPLHPPVLPPHPQGGSRTKSERIVSYRHPFNGDRRPVSDFIYSPRLVVGNRRHIGHNVPVCPDLIFPFLLFLCLAIHVFSL